MPGYIDVDPELRRRLADRSPRETGATHVLGVVGLEFDRRDATDRSSTTAPSSLDPPGRLRARYDKTHLVPFGEFVPLRGLLGFFLEAVARGMATDNVTAGPGPRALDLPAARSGGAADRGSADLL